MTSGLPINGIVLQYIYTLSYSRCRQCNLGSITYIAEFEHYYEVRRHTAHVVLFPCILVLIYLRLCAQISNVGRSCMPESVLQNSFREIDVHSSSLVINVTGNEQRSM